MALTRRGVSSIFLFLGIFFVQQIHGQSGFDIRSLPRGKEVTLPRPAITMVPANESISVAPTDMPQSIKLTNASVSGKLRVAIHDRSAKTVREVSIYPGTPYMYAFNELGSLAITGVGESHAPNVMLRIESNKPLSISR